MVTYTVPGWDDYCIGRVDTQQHLAVLDVVYAGIIEAQREARSAGKRAAKR